MCCKPHGKKYRLPSKFNGKPLECFNREQHDLICVFERSLWPGVGECKWERPGARVTSEELLK